MKLTNFGKVESIFLKIDGVNLHYRQLGNGPFIFLLHPSPRSSKMMVPLMNLLATDFTVVAPDLPGYGFSAPLPKKPASLYDYLPLLHEFVKKITNQPVIFYGTATGAQLAIAYGLTYPENTAQLYLDNAAHFTVEEYEDIVVNYFPDFTPKADGSHLQAIWQHVCDSCLYFPWYNKRQENKIADELPPPAIIQAIADDYILAGANYADAYLAAFKHERAEKLKQVTCGTTIFKWMGSPLLKYMNRLLDFELPGHIKAIETDLMMQKRYEQMKEAILQQKNKHLSLK